MPNYNLKLDVDEDGVYLGSPVTNKPEQRIKPGRCKICNTPLNSYRLGDYCGVHQLRGQEIEDERKENKRYKLTKQRYKKVGA